MSDRRLWTRVRTHIGDAVRWTTDAEIGLSEGLIAGLSFVGPILFAAALGNLPLGLIASAGSLPIGRVGPGRSLFDQGRSLALSVLPTIVAAAIAEFLVGGGLAGRLLTIVCAGVAALLGGYDRTAAIVTTRFTLFLIIAQSMSAATPHPAAMMALLTAGALWTALLWLLFGAVVRSTTSRTPILAEQGPAAAAPAKLARWRASLGRPAGWHFTLKLVSCLVAAEALDQTFPNHHLQWIALTVVILAQRRTNLFPIKVTQRALGAGAGVLLAGLCLAAHPSAWTLTGCIGLIAGTRPLLKSRHYVPIPR